MKQSLHKIFTTTLLILSFIIGGCSEESNFSGVNCDSQNLEFLTGSYTLSSFTTFYSDSTIITEEEFDTFSGTMNISSDCIISQVITVDGDTTKVNDTISAVGDDMIEITSGSCAYTLFYSLEIDQLTTTIHQGSCGIDYSEVNIWQKTNNQSAFIQSMSDDIENDYEFSDALVGGVAGSIEQGE